MRGLGWGLGPAGSSPKLGLLQTEPGLRPSALGVHARRRSVSTA